MTQKKISYIAALALAGLLTGGAATDAAAANQFRGNACIITASPACAALGWSVGNCAAARFYPPNWNGNANRTGLSLYWGYYAQNFTYPSGSMVGAVMRPLQASGIGNGMFTYSATGRIAGQVPAAPVAGAPVLSSTIYINGFEESCNVTLRFQGQRYPLP